MRNLVISSLAIVLSLATGLTAQATPRPLDLPQNSPPLVRADYLHPNNTDSQPLFDADGGSAPGVGLFATTSREPFAIFRDNHYLQPTWDIPASFRLDAEVISTTVNHGKAFSGPKNLFYLVGDQDGPDFENDDNDFDNDNAAVMLFSKTLVGFGYRGNSTNALFEFVYRQEQPSLADLVAIQTEFYADYPPGRPLTWNPLFPVGSQIGVIVTIDGSSGFDANNTYPFLNDFTGGNAGDFAQAFPTAVPEPGTGALLGLGLAGLGLLAWRRHRRRAGAAAC